MGTRTLAAEVLGSAPWREPSRSPPLAPPKSLHASVLGRLRPNNPKYYDNIITISIADITPREHKDTEEF